MSRRADRTCRHRRDRGHVRRCALPTCGSSCRGFGGNWQAGKWIGQGTLAKIAFLIPDLRSGGAERVALTLVAEFATRGHEVDLLVMGRKGELIDDLPAGVRLVNLNAPRIRDVVRPLIRYLRQHRPDAIQVSLWPLTIAGIVAVRLSRVPVRVVVSDHISLSRQFGAKKLRLAMLKLSTRLFYPRADVRVCVSHGSSRDLARVSGVPEQAITTIYNPVPRSTAIHSGTEQLWGRAKARFLSVGTLKGQKNHALLLDAFALVAEELDAKLIIAGDGPLHDLLERQIVDLGLQERVELAGHVTDVAVYYASADVFVLSSDYEGFALVLVEALHHGLRIVSTDCPDGPSEILRGGQFGRLTPVGNARALADAMVAEFREERDAGRQAARAADFSPGRAADAYLAALLGRGGYRHEPVAEAEAKAPTDFRG